MHRSLGLPFRFEVTKTGIHCVYGGCMKNVIGPVFHLLDKEDVIQYVRPGGDYVKGDKDYQEIENKINALL